MINDKKTELLQKQSLFFNKIEKLFRPKKVQTILDADNDIIRNTHQMETFQDIAACGT